MYSVATKSFQFYANVSKYLFVNQKLRKYGKNDWEIAEIARERGALINDFCESFVV